MDRLELEKLFTLYETHREDMDSYNAAFDGYTKMLKENPEDIDALWHMGLLNDFRSRELMDAAAEHYEKALRLLEGPEHELYTKLNYQLININSKSGKSFRTIEFYKNSLENEPDNMKLYCFLIFAYLRAQQPKDAWKVCQSAMKVNPEHPMILYFAGDVCNALERYEDALTYWTRSLEIEPNLTDSRYGKAFLLKSLGRLEEAKTEFEGIVEWLLAHNFTIEADWPREEIAKIDVELAKR